MAKDLVGDEPFAVMLGDDIIDNDIPCMRQMLDVFEREHAPVVAVHRVPRAEVSSYGVIAGEPLQEDDRVYRVSDLVEKPSIDQAPSDLAIIGRYILTPDIFPILEQTPRDARGEIQLTNALRRLLEQRPIVGYRAQRVGHDRRLCDRNGVVGVAVQEEHRRSRLLLALPARAKRAAARGGGHPRR